MSGERTNARRTAVVVAAGLLALAIPVAAWAHAYLVRTSPASGAVLKSSPGRVTLVYDEPVTISTGALGVYDASGKHVDSGQVTQPVGDTIAVAIPRRLAHGTYTVAWRVTSADTHVVHGAFTFSVGAPGKTGGIAAKLEASQAIPRSITVPFAAVRFANFLLILAACGGALALVLVLRDADPPVRARLARAIVVCGGLLAVAAAAGLPFEAAESAGSDLGGGFAAKALAEVRDLRFGQVWLTRAWLALLLALLALSLEHVRRWRRAREAALLAVGVALLLTPSAAGHADVNGTLAFAADAAHVAAAAAWTGGLAFLVAALALSPAAGRWELAARTVPRFSTLAVGAVAVLLVAGVTSAYLEVRTWRGLWQSTYGELVLTKAALVLPILALGAFNNRISVPRLRARIASPLARRRFLVGAAAELTLLVAIVAVTAVLVDERPAKDVLAQAARTRGTTTTTRVGPFAGSVKVTPAFVGPNAIDLSFATGKGRPAALAEVDVAASLPSRNIGPLRFTARRLARGRFQVAAAQLPIPGAWQLRLTVRQGQFDEWLQTVPIEIRKEPGT